MEKKRLDFIDICSAIMLLYMINVHLSDYNWCTKSTFGFMDYLIIPFLPFFFYKAGIFHRTKKPMQMINYTFKRLIIPFIVFSAIGEIVHSIRLCIEFNDFSLYSHIVIPLGTLILKGSIHGNLALWFLITLFVVKNIYNFICRLSPKRQCVVVGISLLLAGVFSYINKIYSPLFVPYLLANTCSGLVFYATGHHSSLLKKYKNISLPLSLFLFLVISFICPSGCNMRSNDVSGSYLAWVTYSISFVFIFLFIFEKAGISNKMLCSIGQNSMAWYVLHWPLILLSRLIFLSGFGMHEGWPLRLTQTLFILIITPILILVIKKWCPIIIGENNRTIIMKSFKTF